MSSLELQILKLLWEKLEPVDLDAIQLATGADPDMVAEVLKTLTGKAMVVRYENGYRPLLSKEEYSAAEIRRMVDMLYGGDIIAFLEDYKNGVEPEAQAELRKLIDKSKETGNN